MNGCPEQSEWVLYAADELPLSRRDELRAHLAGCAACRQESATLARGLRAMESLERRPAMSEAAESALSLRLAQAVERRAARPWILTLVTRHRWAAAAAVIFWVALAAALVTPVHRPHAYMTDSQVSDEIATITTMVDLLEHGDMTASVENGVNHPPPSADKNDEDVEWFLEELSNELGVEG